VIRATWDKDRIVSDGRAALANLMLTTGCGVSAPRSQHAAGDQASEVLGLSDHRETNEGAAAKQHDVKRRVQWISEKHAASLQSTVLSRKPSQLTSPKLVHSSGLLAHHFTGVVFHGWQAMPVEIVINSLPDHERDRCSCLCRQPPKLLELVRPDEQ
jgi:hypothetical protein